MGNGTNAPRGRNHCTMICGMPAPPARRTHIPHDDVIRRFAGRWEAVSKVLPYCDEAEFYDNDNGFALVAEYRNGELRTVGKHQP